MRMDMDLVVIASTIVVTSIGYPLARAIARVIESRGARQAHLHDPEVAARLRNIEQAVEAMSIEMERVTEHQRFVTKLLSDRAGAGASSNGAPGAAAPPTRPVGQG
jgi:hypothetical protein